MATKSSIKPTSGSKKTKAPSAGKVSATKKPAPADTKPKANSRKARVTKSSTSKIGGNLSLDVKVSVKEPVIAHDDIATRAYFIAERRHKMGWPGNSKTDWAEAVSQLRAEALEKPLKKR